MNSLASLGGLSGDHSIEIMSHNGYINGMVKVGIDILCILTNEEDFRPFFMMNSFKLYMQVVMPYLKLSEKERENIEEDPKEFVNYSLDIC